MLPHDVATPEDAAMIGSMSPAEMNATVDEWDRTSPGWDDEHQGELVRAAFFGLLQGGPVKSLVAAVPAIDAVLGSAVCRLAGASWKSPDEPNQIALDALREAGADKDKVSAASRRMAESPWTLWLPKGDLVPRFVHALVALVPTEPAATEPEAEKAAGVALPVLERTRKAHFNPHARLAGGRGAGEITREMGDDYVDSRTGEVLGLVLGTDRAPVVPDNIAMALRSANSVAGHRLFRLLVTRVYRQYAEGGYEPSKLRFPSFQHLADEMGLPDDTESRAKARGALVSFQHLHFAHIEGHQIGGLCTWVEYAQGDIEISVSPALTPAFVQRLKHQRAIVPVPDREPPMLGRPNERAGLLTLQWEVMRLARERSREYRRAGSFTVSRDDWGRMCRTADLPERMDGDVLTRWTTGDDRVLDRQRDGRFRLGPGYRGAEKTVTEATTTVRQGQARIAKRWGRRRKGLRGSTPVLAGV
jgi:hypothetical protein